MRILIVEDDALLAAAMESSLAEAGYVVDVVGSGTQALDVLSTEEFDLVVLDVGLPGLDGFEVLGRIRRRRNPVPVIVLTARDAVEDRIRGLDLGADEYLVKPVMMAELRARVRALLRRTYYGQGPEVRHGALRLDLAGKRAWLGDDPLDLSSREWSVLEFLVSRAGRIVEKEHILQSICGWDREITLNAIEKYIQRLRAKIEPAVRIRTVRGLGYLLEKVEHDAK